MKTFVLLKYFRHSIAIAFCSVMATTINLSNSWAAFAQPAASSLSSSSSSSSSVPSAANELSTAKVESATAYPKPAEWKHLNEQEWLVDGIGRDIAEILGYAKYMREGNGFAAGDVSLSTKTQDLKSGTYSYSATIGRKGPSFDYKLTLVDYIWSPKTYVPFAKKLLRLLNLQPRAASQIPSEFLNNISKAELKFLFVENERISKALSENPLDASLHEQAALLLGVFASLELCGSFTDTRSLLSRMSAHLTLAEALNQERLGSVGEMANAILESLSCRKRIAFEAVKQIESQNHSPIEKSILRAIKMRIDHDPRVYDEANSTPFEDLIFCQFYTQSHTIEDALKRFEKYDVPFSQQWRIMLSSGKPTVASGSFTSAKMLSSEISEFIGCRDAYKKVHDGDFSSCCEELNLQPGGCLSKRGEIPALNVLSWELVCSFFQRQFAYAMILEYQYYKWSLHVNEVAQQVKDDAYKNFSKLNLFPFAADRFILKGDERRAVYAAIKKLLVERPEAVSSQIWKLTVQKAAKSTTIPLQCPSPEAWFDPTMPLGTVFVERYDQKNCPKSLAFYEELRRLNPFDAWLAMAWAKEKYGEFPTAEQYREAFGSLVDYDDRAIHLVCRGELHKPEKFIVLAEKIAKEDPKMYFDLADYCVINHMPKKAVEYYEKAFESVPDHVAIANKSDWLVQYFYDSGEKSKAEHLAESAAAVFSRRGLQTLGRLYERQGRLSDAEERYKSIRERYNNDSPLLSFYLRYKEKDIRYAQYVAELLPKIFPSGLEKVSLSSFSGQPVKGIVVQSTWWISDSPLKWDTIIVGINGYAVADGAQYDVVKELTDQKTCSVIYWDGKEYKERKEPTIHHNSLGVSVASYKRPH